jgi:hypothetical protein
MALTFFYYKSIQNNRSFIKVLYFLLIIIGFETAFILGWEYSNQSPYGNLAEVWIRRRITLTDIIRFKSAIYTGIIGGILPNILMILTLKILPDKKRLILLILILEIFICLSVPLVCVYFTEGIEVKYKPYP